MEQSRYHRTIALKARAGVIGGLVGGVVIWFYEAAVWVGAQHLLPLSAIPSNATGLVFGEAIQHQLGAGLTFSVLVFTSASRVKGGVKVDQCGGAKGSHLGV